MICTIYISGGWKQPHAHAHAQRSSEIYLTILPLGVLGHLLLGLCVDLQ